MDIYKLNLIERVTFDIKISNTISSSDKRDIYLIEILRTSTGWVYSILNQYTNEIIRLDVIPENGTYIQDSVYNLNLHEFKFLNDSTTSLSIMRVHNGWIYFNYNPKTYKAISFYYVPQILSSVSGGINGTYTNSTPLPVTHGGAIVGMTFSGLTMQEMFDLILYPYQNPSFTTFYLNGYSGSFEIGYEITVNQVFNWNTRTRNWTIQAENTNNVTFSRNYSIRFDYRMYVGNSSATILDENQIESLTDFNQVHNGKVHNGKNGTFTVSAGGYKFIAFADIYGNVSSFKDPDNGFDIDMFDGYSNSELTWSYEIISVTNTLGQTSNYRLYRTTYELGGSQKITIA